VTVKWDVQTEWSLETQIFASEELAASRLQKRHGKFWKWKLSHFLCFFPDTEIILSSHITELVIVFIDALVHDGRWVLWRLCMVILWHSVLLFYTFCDCFYNEAFLNMSGRSLRSFCSSTIVARDSFGLQDWTDKNSAQPPVPFLHLWLSELLRGCQRLHNVKWLGTEEWKMNWKVAVVA